ncbi:alpha-ketoacid dehydrogenase subunit beta [Falsiroseomonas sp.]|uniref:alpha-ketoacid dehydrogenase subunit beta n=1 Tax=Falsiroseomonas sp. TaxID=2870721 RepID=UPI003564E0C2
MREITYRDALAEALIEELERFPEMVIMGEDLIAQGGVFGVHRRVHERFPDRILETPIAEPGFVGMAVGAAMTGGPVVVEIMFQDFIAVCMDEIVNQAAKMRYMSGGQARMPLVIRAPYGVGRGSGAQHTQALDSWFVHVPGLTVAMPSNPADAKGLLKTAIRGSDPVLFFEHKALYWSKGPVPDGPEVTVPFGSARIVRAGRDATVVATGRMVEVALEAAHLLGASRISVEVVDPRTLSPIDMRTIYASVERTNRVLVVDEATPRCSVGADIAAAIGEHRFDSLDAPVRRLNAPHAPKPFAPGIERLSVPQVEDVVRMVEELVLYRV